MGWGGAPRAYLCGVLLVAAAFAQEAPTELQSMSTSCAAYDVVCHGKEADAAALDAVCKELKKGLTYTLDTVTTRVVSTTMCSGWATRASDDLCATWPPTSSTTCPSASTLLGALVVIEATATAPLATVVIDSRTDGFPTHISCAVLWTDNGDVAYRQGITRAKGKDVYPHTLIKEFLKCVSPGDVLHFGKAPGEPAWAGSFKFHDVKRYILVLPETENNNGAKTDEIREVPVAKNGAKFLPGLTRRSTSGGKRGRMLMAAHVFVHSAICPWCVPQATTDHVNQEGGGKRCSDVCDDGESGYLCKLLSFVDLTDTSRSENTHRRDCAAACEQEGSDGRICAAHEQLHDAEAGGCACAQWQRAAPRRATLAHTTPFSSPSLSYSGATPPVSRQ